MSLIDSIYFLSDPFRIENYKIKEDKLYIKKRNGNTKKRVFDRSIHSLSGLIFGFRYYLYQTN